MRRVYTSSLYRALMPGLLRLFGPIHVRLYRLLRGRVVGRLSPERMPLLLLTTVGRRSGRELTRVVAYVPDGPSWIVVGDSVAVGRVPEWILNIRAQQRVSIQVGAERLAACATIMSGQERDDAWRAVTGRYAFFETYQSTIQQKLPVLRLTRD